MNSHDIRKTFLKFFEERGHRIVRSSSLVPANDPTLLFANAGMNQFKDVFLGREKRDYARACSSQKCVRAGGKHNDLEQVGRTTRHHTFFEMLGNFSFGDYFKKEAIPWAWELITKDFAIPRKKLYVTTFLGSGSGPGEYGLLVPCDNEAYNLWVAEGVSKDRIFRLGLEHNFWQMGDTGPCGPCSEIHYDMGPAASDLGHADCKFPCDCGRYVELWNLVFMEYSRYCNYERDGFPAGWDAKARADHRHSDDGYQCLKLDLLPSPSIDTGAGMERLSAVLQGKISNFDTDLFRPLIEEASDLAHVEYGANHETDVSLRIIADHSRATTFLISDGVLPSNEGRGYVLRLIMRRALYHGQTLGLNEPFLFKMSSRVVDIMKSAYPELLETASHVAKAIKSEEERYAQTTRVGLDTLDSTPVVFKGSSTLGPHEIPFGEYKNAHFSQQMVNLEKHPGSTISARPLPATGVRAWIPGDALFKLHDTFGLRPDFVKDVVSGFGIDVDMFGYAQEMESQRERARASWKGMVKRIPLPVYQELEEKHRTDYDPYTYLRLDGCQVVALVKNAKAIDQVSPVQEPLQVEIVLNKTPFYAEAGGQVGDTGRVVDFTTLNEIATVTDTFSPVSGLVVHKAIVRRPLRVRDFVTAVVDAERRDAIRRNHTATHLLHAALRHTLGTHVKQAGSLVAPDRLRFDFSHYASLDEQDLLDIEDLVNQHILANEIVSTDPDANLDMAVASGAMALFGEKYGDKVRVVSIEDGSFSKELCGGTHVRRTGDIGMFKIVSEASVAAGTRRIEAVTGTGVLEVLRRESQTLRQLGEALRAKPDELLTAVQKLEESEKKLRKQLEAQQLKRAAASAGDLAAGAKEIKGVRVVAARVDVTDRAAMRQMVDNLRARIESGVIVLGSASDGKVALVVAVTQDLTNRLDAGKIVKAAAALVEGSGGGRKDLAEAGGKNPERLDESIQAVPSIVEGML